MKKKPRILAIGHAYVVALNRSVMRELSSKNLDVTVVSPNFFHGDLRSLDVEDEPQGSSLKVVSIDCFLSRAIHFFFYSPSQLRKVIQDVDPDYVLVWEEPYVVSGFQIARLLEHFKIPFSIFTNQNIFKKYPWPFSFFESKSITTSDQLWTCGPLVSETFVRKGFSLKKMKIVPYFVNTDRFQPFNVSQKKQGREKLDLKDQFTIGFMGRLTEEKGCRLFLNVIASLPKNEAWQVLILGSGPLKQEIENWINQHQLQDRCVMMSVAHEEVPQILPLMDVILCPSQTTASWREQFGRMIIESFASGVVVLASDSGEIPFVVDQAGMVMPEKEEALWKEALLSVFKDHLLIEKYRNLGFKRAQDFSVHRVAQTIQEAFEASLKRD